MSPALLRRLQFSPLNVIALLMLFSLSSLHAATLNVPSPSYATIQAGIDAAQPGDTVLVADGTYSGPGNVNLDFGGKDITLLSAHGPDSAIIDCQQNSRGFYLHSGETVAAIISGFTVKNGASQPRTVGDRYGYGGGIYCSSGVTVANCHVTSCETTGRTASGGGIYIMGDAVVADCTIDGNTASGTYAGDGGGLEVGGTATITNCVICGNAARAGAFGDGGGGIYCGSASTLTNCTIYGNSADTGSGGGIFGSFALTNCIVRNNTAYLSGPQINDNPNSHIAVNYCDVQGGFAGIGNFDADPLFVDASAGDFHLQADSPCVSAGTAAGAPAADRDGNRRPNPPSVGAFQYEPRPLFWAAGSFSVGADGDARLLWNETGGEAALWTLDASNHNLGQQHYGPFPQWTVQSVALGADGYTRALVVNPTGEIALWRLDAQNRHVDEVHYGPFVGASGHWTASAMSIGPDGVLHLVWTYPDGTAAFWRLDAQNRYMDQQNYGPFDGGWTFRAISTGPDNITRAVWADTNEEAAFWRLDAANNYIDEVHYGPFPDWTFRSLSTGPGNVTCAVWTSTSGEAAFWRLDAANGYMDQIHYGPFPGWSVQGLAATPDGGARVLWVQLSGEAALWRLDAGDNYIDQQHYGPY